MRIRLTRKDQGALRRLEHEFPRALSYALERLALKVGRRIAENVEAFKQFPPGTRRLARSFLVPWETTPSVFLLGREAPVYAGIHEYGGTIHARNADFLTFQYPPGSGEWHSVKEVTIREKRYARDAIDTEGKTAAQSVAMELVHLIR